MDVNSVPPPHQKTEEMLAWIELVTAFVGLGIVLFSLFQALRSCSSNNNDAPPEVDGGAPCLIVLTSAATLSIMCLCINDFVLVLGFYLSVMCLC
uniref:Uncharacterized protein n=1 Tax=Fagus sylvatica TaxID=28930 RepID=A0A2N9GSP0_FAGSY